MNILFICSRNKWRSRTAETIFKNNGQHIIKSAGTEAPARIQVNQKLINWADWIYVMEAKHQARIQTKFKINCPLEVLGIPDHYRYMEEALIDILRSTVQLPKR